MVMQNLFSIQNTILNITSADHNHHMLEQFNTSSTLKHDAAEGDTFFVPTLTTILLQQQQQQQQRALSSLADTVLGKGQHGMDTVAKQQQLVMQQRLTPIELFLGTITYLMNIGITILGFGKFQKNVALTSSASIMAMASGEKSPPNEHGGNSAEVAASQQKTMHPETVELKTHLKQREKISVAKEKRAAKTIAVIIVVFTFCWLPFFCAYVIMPFCSSCYLHPKVHQAFVWRGYINSSLNPFLYGILNLEFRRAFRKILCPKRVQNAQRRRLSEQASVRKKSAASKPKI